MSQVGNEKEKFVRRVLLDGEVSDMASHLVKKLRKNSCILDTSQLVNVVLHIFFEKYIDSEYETISNKFFDRKKYLKSLINKSSNQEIDDEIKKYLGKFTRKKRGRKPRKKEEKPKSSDTCGV